MCPQCGDPCSDWLRICGVCGFRIGRHGQVRHLQRGLGLSTGGMFLGKTRSPSVRAADDGVAVKPGFGPPVRALLESKYAVSGLPSGTGCLATLLSTVQGLDTARSHSTDSIPPLALPTRQAHSPPFDRCCGGVHLDYSSRRRICPASASTSDLAASHRGG
jgi:hypothetical protein